MSGVLKGLGKVFRKVVKVVKKLALPALAIGAIVLTGGAAIGALPALGTMIGGLGLSAGVTAALTSAVSTAAIGAGIGGATAALSGGDVLKGMGMGGAAGFVSGGLLGAGGLLAGGARAAGTAAAGAGGSAVEGVTAGLMPGTGTAAGTAILGGAGATATAAAPVLAAAPAGAAAAGAGGGGLLSSITNPMVLGPLLQGVGGGISNASVAKDARKAAQDERDRIAANYGGGVGILSSAGRVSTDPNRPTPTMRFDPRTYGGTYQFDATLGRVVFVPNQG